MPDHGCRTKSQPPAGSAHTPADIHIVACHSKLRIEAAYRLEPIPSKSHVASRNVFGLLVGEENMSGSPGCASNAGCEFSVLAKRNVRAADAGAIHPSEGGGEIVEPVWVGASVVVNVGNDFAAGCRQPKVTGGA